MAGLNDFGEQFASKVLEKTYQTAVFRGITNNDYEGEIKKPGDRVNILSFLNSLTLSDYVVGTDMSNEAIVDAEDVLVVEKRKYYNFALDKLEDLFTYGGDIPAQLLTDGAAVLERSIDTYVLNKFGENVKAGNWVGVDLVVAAVTNTNASIVTTATGGTITVVFNSTDQDDQTAAQTVENPRDGTSYFGGFQTSDLYKGIRLRSTAAFVTPWYRISAVTNTVAVDVTEWDQAVSGSDFSEGHTLRGLFGGDGRDFPINGTGNPHFGTWSAAGSGIGWEIQAAIATGVTSALIYEQTTLLSEALDEGEVPDTGRKIVVPPAALTMLKQASELQPTGIGEIYSGVVINGRVMRIGGFDVHVAAGTRVSTRAGHDTSTGNGASLARTTGTTGYLIPAMTTAACTYADKWSESRVIDAELQFARKYQGLYLFGALIPAGRRKYSAMLFGSF